VVVLAVSESDFIGINGLQVFAASLTFVLLIFNSVTAVKTVLLFWHRVHYCVCYNFSVF